ncbi:hypothetical protein [Streptococcus suis]|uniref:hypothetical protein n=1 Tax=Streptococcus suis TaxID=1307 RepID=UPI001FC9C6D6
MSFINQFKSQSKTVLAAVAISAATLGFAGGMSISKSSAGVSTQSQASLAQNNSAATNGQVAASANTQGMPPGQGGAPQGMSPGQGGAPQDMPPGQGGVPQGMPPGQGACHQVKEVLAKVQPLLMQQVEQLSQTRVLLLMK